MLSGKVWGDTQSLLITPMIEVHRINILPHMKCSVHKHEHKYNMFYVISGELYLTVTKTEYDLEDITKLFAGQSTTVQPNEYHRFYTLDKPVEALEIYYLSSLDTKDIKRIGVGGQMVI